MDDSVILLPEIYGQGRSQVIDPTRTHFHLIGVGGSGMSGLAAFLRHCGANVSGSDREHSAAIERLRSAGAHIACGATPAALPDGVEAVVASAAVPADHPELLHAHSRGVPVLKYAQLLGLLMGQRRGIAVAGAHGKSTTTAWLSFTLRHAGLDPSFVIGADVQQLGGGSGVGDGPHFVAEACEYDRSFLNLRPDAAVVLNIDEDHLDYYADLAEIEAAFAEFARQVPEDGYLLVCGDDPLCRRLDVERPGREMFGLTADSHWRAERLELVDGRYAFDLIGPAGRLGRAHSGLPGKHNVGNALAVAALASRAGVETGALLEALAEFRGAGRRLQLLLERGGVRVLDDYAHHPREIAATLRAARDRYAPSRVWCVFQPHQHSRTRFLMKDFARSFAEADRILVPDIYFVRDSQIERTAVSAEDLVARIIEHGGAAEHVACFGRIADMIAAELAPGDLVITMGAGDVWKIAHDLAQRL